jgi:hypothetical protein
MGIVSGKSWLKSPTSSCASACRAMTVVLVSLQLPCSANVALCTFEGLLNVNGLLCARLKVWDAALGLAEGLGTLR